MKRKRATRKSVTIHANTFVYGAVVALPIALLLGIKSAFFDASTALRLYVTVPWAGKLAVTLSFLATAAAYFLLLMVFYAFFVIIYLLLKKAYYGK